MKFLFVCVLILAILAGGCLVGAVHISSVIEETSDLLCRAITLQQSNQAECTFQYLSAAAAFWNSHRTTLGILLLNSDIDTVETGIHQLETLADGSDPVKFRTECTVLLSKLAEIKEAEWPYWYNIL